MSDALRLGVRQVRLRAMSMFRVIPSFATLARVLILTLAMGWAFDNMPFSAAQAAGCAVTSDCRVSPADQQNEPDGMSLGILGVVAESAQSLADAEAVSSFSPSPAIFAAARQFGIARDLRHLRGPADTLPNKTGPPRA
jgi:hypothetical protein